MSFPSQNRSAHAFRRIGACFTVLFFLISVMVPPSRVYAQTLPTLPPPGTMVTVSPGFHPVLLRGLKVFPDNPFRFDFIVDSGDTGLKGEALKEESTKIIQDFLVSLTVPEDDLWVNLSPYEQDRVIPPDFGATGMGRDMLAQDYLLKQLTASLIYPEEDLGEQFWEKIYQEAYRLYGTTEVPINTFNKVWIVPDRAAIYEQGDTVFVVESRLKVMLEEDYLALGKNIQKEEIGTDSLAGDEVKALSRLSSKIVRELIIPAIEKEVNEGENFARLRQIYHSLILATWYKDTLKESLLNQVYSDKKKLAGVDLQDKKVGEKIYRRYLEAFRKGAFNLIKEDYDPHAHGVIARKYFSGGVDFVGTVRRATEKLPVDTASEKLGQIGFPAFRVPAVLPPISKIEDHYMAEFKIGGENSTEVIARLTQLNGVAIETIENRARPGGYSYSGFIGSDERFVDVLIRDNEFVLSNGFTHQDLAEPLLEAMRVENGEFTFRERRYRVGAQYWRGMQDSIFNDRLDTNKDYMITDIETGETISFSGLIPEFIKRYGFYEGDTDYRLDPRDIIRMFFPDREIAEAPAGQIQTAGAEAVPEQVLVDDATGAEAQAEPTTGEDSHFAIGGVNSSEAIQKLKEINGRPVKQIQENAVEENWLSITESFLDVLLADNVYVRSKGFTHQQLAEPLRIAVEKAEKGEFSFGGQNYDISSSAWRGYDHSIFNDHLTTNRAYRIDNPRTGQSITFDGLTPEYIHRYGFYGGPSEYQRLNPDDIIEMFDLVPKAQIDRDYNMAEKKARQNEPTTGLGGAEKSDIKINYAISSVPLLVE